jgi:Holliday junction resolvasome RuvABC DNA-binding subunit
MIARLAGTLLTKQPGRAVIDVGGIGYEVLIPLSTYYEIGDPGGRVELHIHTHVREDTLALFGFRTGREKELFVRLIGVSGIGPSAAAGSGPGGVAGGASVRQDLVSALVNLGYNARVAGEAAGRVLKGRGGHAPPFETLLRETLRVLSR